MKKLKILLLTTATLFLTVVVFGQARTVSTMIEKENRNAVMIEINQPLDITTDALQQKLQREGFNEKIRKGSASYKGVVLSEISKEKIDLYTKVEQGPNNTSVVYMAVSRGYNNFTNSEADNAIIENTKAFLNAFVKDADNHFADVDISNQIKVQNKSENEYQQLLDEQRDLEKKKSKIDIRLTEIQNELNARKADIDKKKTGVEDSQTKRTNNQ
jgi:multidrug efflux pump subunit AcrB